MRNVVVLSLDSVRKDVFDCRAHRLADRADLTVESCRAASSWSAPSYASMLTGELPHRHGVHAHGDDFRSVPRSATFLDEIAFSDTFGVSTNVFAGSAFGFDRFFDQFVDVTETCRSPGGIDPGAVVSDHDGPTLAVALAVLRSMLWHDKPLQSLANGAIGLLDTVSESRPVPKLFDDGATAVIRETKRAVDDATEPFFGFGVFMEAHTPLRHVRGFDRSIHAASNGFTTDNRTVWELMDATEQHTTFLKHRRELYAASIDYLDRKIAPFVDWIQSNTDLETTIVVTADHGENQGYPCEEGRVRHKSSLSEGLLHVPLIVFNPPDGYPESVDDHVSHLDLGSLLVALATDKAPPPTSSRIVAEHIGMSAGPRPPANEEYWDRLMRAAYDGTTKVVWDSLGDCRRYKLDRNRPCWQRRASTGGTPPKWAMNTFETDAPTSKRNALAADSAIEHLDNSVVDRLEKLGYV